jgi:hypothetical protein
MSEAESALADLRVSARRRRTRRRALAALVLVVLAGLYAGLVAWLGWASERRYRAAASEADRLDPGWRFAEIQGRRARVPDRENSALRVLVADIEGGRAEPPESLVNELGPEFWLSKPLGGERLSAVCAALAPMRPALEEALAVAGMPRGRYEVNWSRDIFSTRLDHLQAARRVARWLWLDAALRAHEGDVEGALHRARAVLNVARSIGDEPLIIPQLTRAQVEGLAVGCLEAALAGGETSEAMLASLQSELDKGDEPSALLAGLRGERAALDELMERVRSGEVDLGSVLANSPRTPRWFDSGRAVRDNQTRLLTTLTELVELAKQPAGRQRAAFREQERLWVARFAAMNPVERVSWRPSNLLMPGTIGFVDACLRMRALRSAASTALAVERYRLAHGRWPDSLEQLVPEYLTAVPTDPFLDMPLRYRRETGGVVVYSVGPDDQDDGGRRDPDNPTGRGSDLGFYLRDPSQRGPGKVGP